MPGSNKRARFEGANAFLDLLAAETKTNEDDADDADDDDFIVTVNKLFTNGSNDLEGTGENFQSYTSGSAYESARRNRQENEEVASHSQQEAAGCSSLKSVDNFELEWMLSGKLEIFAKRSTDAPVFTLRVQRGREEEFTSLVNEYLVAILGKGADVPWAIYSVLARSTIPGFVYVEARSLADVQKLCHTIPFAHGKISVADPQDVLAVLGHRSPSFELGRYPWVRVKRGLYRGDLGYVVDCDTGGRMPSLNILIIPRISPAILHPVSDEEHKLVQSKVKDVQGSQLDKRKRAVASSRPHAHLFDPIVTKATWGHVGANRLTQRLKSLKDDEWKFTGKTYLHGLLKMGVPLHSLNFAPAHPTRAELQLWRSFGYKLIHEDCVSSLQQLDEELWVDDKVELLGAHLGQIGKVMHLDDGIATVFIMGKEGEETADVPIKELRKHFTLHDFVNVTSGMHEGKSGWVLKYSHDVHNRGEVVLSEVSSYTELTCRPDQVHISTPPFEFAKSPPSQPLLESELLCQLPNRQNLWFGMPVCITRKHNEGLLGIIRSVTEWYHTPTSKLTNIHDSACSCVVCFDYRDQSVRMLALQVAHSDFQKIVCQVFIGATMRIESFDILEFRPADGVLGFEQWKWLYNLRDLWGERNVYRCQAELSRTLAGTDISQRRRWQRGMLELIRCQQLLKLHLTFKQLNRPVQAEFLVTESYECAAPLGSGLKELDGRDEIDEDWYLTPFDVKPTSNPNVNTRGNSNEGDEYTVDLIWLDGAVRQLPLFIVMAGGARSFKPSYDNKEGHLFPNTYNEALGTVQVFIRGIGKVDVPPDHILPKHPHKTPAPNSISLVTPLKGPRKGQVTRLVKIEDDNAWVNHWENEGILQYRRVEFALTKVPTPRTA